VRTIHVVATSHWNLGDAAADPGSQFPYHMPVTPEVVKLDAKAHLDQVLDAVLQNGDMYWTVEALWPFEAWWENTPDTGRRNAMLRLVREGRITLSAVSHNYRSAFLGGEEVNRVCYDSERLRRSFALPIDTAIVNDVPGWNWSLVQPLSRSGVRYFLAGPNHFIGGALTLPPKDIPFWWQGPDGSRLLTWVCVGGYTEAQTRVFVNPSAGRFFTGLGVVMPGVDMKGTASERDTVMRMRDPELMDYSIGKELARLRDAGYPYDAILLMYAHDAQGPDSIVGTMKHIRDWNRRHKSPQIVLSSPRRFFEHMESKRSGASFPSYSGDWAGLWESANFPQNQLFALRRFVRNHAPALEKAASIAQIAGSSPYPLADLRRINAMVLEDDDQGMVNGAAVPVTSYQATRALYHAMLTRLATDVATTVPAIVVMNPSSWGRSDPVDSPLRPDLWEKGFPLVDGVTGARVAVDRTADRWVHFVAEGVPPVGYKVYYADPGVKGEAPAPEVGAPDAATIENAFYRVSVDAQSGDVRSLFDKQANRELAGAYKSRGLNSLCQSPKALWGAIDPVASGSVQTSATVGGPTARLTVWRKGSPWAWSEISLHAGVRRVDIRNKFAVPPRGEGAEAYFLAFPFALDEARVVQRIENANAFLTPGGPGAPSTFLPGAYTGAFIVSRAVDLHEGAEFGIAMAQRQNECVQFDSTPSVVFSKLLTRGEVGEASGIEQATQHEFDYAITSYSGPFDPVAAKRLGEAHMLPLWGDWRPGSRPGDIFAPRPGPLKTARQSFLDIDEPNVMLSAWKQSEHGDANTYLLRFQEVAGRESTLVTARSPFVVEEAQPCDMVERPLASGDKIEAAPLRFRIGPHATESLLVRFAPMARSPR
jgi:hypothetical protein